MGTYKDYVMSQVPPWLQRSGGKEYLESHANHLDILKEALVAALESSWALNCPTDALAYIGSERQLEKYPNEDLETYRIRLWDAWNAWYWAGTEKGLIEQLKLATQLSNITVRTNAQWDDGPPDGNVNWWSRFWVIIGPPHPYTAHKWGTGRWGDGRLWGADIHPDDLELMRRVIKKWKPSHAYCDGIRIVFDDSEINFPVRA